MRLEEKLQLLRKQNGYSQEQLADKFMNADRDTAKAAIMKQFSLTEDKAEEYLKLYW